VLDATAYQLQIAESDDEEESVIVAKEVKYG